MYNTWPGRLAGRPACRHAGRHPVRQSGRKAGKQTGMQKNRAGNASRQCKQAGRSKLTKAVYDIPLQIQYYIDRIQPLVDNCK